MRRVANTAMMSSDLVSARRLRATDRLARRRARFSRLRAVLDDGTVTTVHVASYDRAAFALGVVAFERPQQLAAWCRERAVRHAIVGGFFSRPAYAPLGEVWIGGRRLDTEPFHAPWGAVRACVAVDGDGVRIGRRDELPARPDGDLLQAGPLLVRDGAFLLDGDLDAEGFSAGSEQFDSDITAGRYPRAALALTDSRLLAVACDGRTDADAGLTLGELARLLVELGARDAVNLDGGGSASLIHNGRLRNRPREEHGVDLLGGRPVVTALTFTPR